MWIVWNLFPAVKFDPYPFLFLNWILTVVSTLQNPVILLSQNRQNDFDRENMRIVMGQLVRGILMVALGRPLLRE